MRILIFSFSNNKVNEDSFIPNEKGLTFSCVDECINELNKQEIQNEHICINYKNIKNIEKNIKIDYNIIVMLIKQ